MERKFYTENFEKFLKERADQFKLTPSKRVWHGIYNDLHPGRRWPSVTMSLMFIFALVVIGHLNTNNEHNQLLTKFTTTHNSASILFNQIFNAKATVKKSEEAEKISPSTISSTQEANKKQPANTSTGITLSPVINEDDLTGNTAVVSYAQKNNDQTTSAQKSVNDEINTADPSAINNNDANILETESETPEYSTTAINNIALTASKISLINKKITQKIAQGSAANIFKNIKFRKATWTYYVSPSISYRHINSEAINMSALPAAFNMQSANNYAGNINKPIAGLEAGSTVSYSITRQLQFITGVQLNYSGYLIQASNTHPIMGTLILYDNAGQAYTYSDMSHFGNGTGTQDARLKNYNLQASVPIGLQYQFFSNDAIKLNAVATLQPSFVVASHAYLLSTDGRNYLTDPELSRKWNMSTNFGTYISFRSNSFNWQIGPQIHYQILSTYSNNYPYREHLIDYGIRFGVSKILK